jgi:SAM-dependent methyltransferase
MWDNPDYRKTSPGEALTEFFQIACKPEPEDFIIDFGCGTGRATKALKEAGFRVLGIDFASNCLDADIDVDFAEYNLWELPEEMKCDWGYCCDVMEHIPSSKVDDVLANIARSCRKGCFFNISMEPDNFSKGSSDKLHLTVMPVEWWINMLEKHFGDTIHYIYDSKIFMSIKLST